MLCVVLFLAASALVSGSRPPHYGEEEAPGLFAEHVQKYSRGYTRLEYQYRLGVFKQNLQKINKLNKEHSSAYFGINQFTDLTDEEFRQYYLGFKAPNNTETRRVHLEDIEAPDSLDYRQLNMVTPVKNQGQCGSCYIFSTIGNIEGVYAKLHQQLLSFSEQMVLDCAAPNGCSGGWPDQTMNAIAAKGGVMTTDSYPAYSAQPGQCQFDPSKVAAKVNGGQQLQTSEEQLADVLYQTGPLSIAIDASGWGSYAGGIFPVSSCTAANPDHAVLLVGYGNDGGPYWIIKNSWDTTWGEQGYIRLQKGVHACFIGQFVYSASLP